MHGKIAKACINLLLSICCFLMFLMFFYHFITFGIQKIDLKRQNFRFLVLNPQKWTNGTKIHPPLQKAAFLGKRNQDREILITLYENP